MRKNKKMEEMEKALRNAVKKSIFLCMSGLTGYLEKKIGRLLVHVTFMLDEFLNVALPDEYCFLLSTIRSREIMLPDEVRKMDNKKCLIFIRGFDPILDDKYNQPIQPPNVFADSRRGWSSL